MPGIPKDSSFGQESLEMVLRKAVHDVDEKVTGLFLSCVRYGIYGEEYAENHANSNCCCLSKDIGLQGDESF